MHHLIRKIFAINRQLKEFAEKKDWQSLRLSAEERQDVLEKYFNEIKVHNSSEINELVTAIQQNDDEITNQIKNERKCLISEGLNLQKSKNAIREYRSHPGN